MTTAGKHIRSVPLISEVTSLKCLRFDFVYERVHCSSVERGLCCESRDAIEALRLIEASCLKQNVIHACVSALFNTAHYCPGRQGRQGRQARQGRHGRQGRQVVR